MALAQDIHRISLHRRRDPERPGKILDVLKPVIGVLGECSGQCRVDLRIDRWQQRGDRRRRRLQMHAHQFVLVVGPEGGLARQHFIQGHGEAVHIATLVTLGAAQLLGGNIQQGPNDPAVARLALRTAHTGNAEIHDLEQAIGRDHDIGWLDVTMDHAHPVRIRQGGCRLRDHRQALPLAEGMQPPHHFLQSVATDQLHHHVFGLAFMAKRIQCCDIGMAQPRKIFRFGPEARGEIRVTAQMRQ